MQVYVINLERNPERLEFIGQRLESLKIDFMRIDAVDGYALDKEYIEEFRKNSKRPTGWKEGQIGCFLSHRKVWEQISTGDNEYGIVLEDDLHLADSINNVISDLSWIPKDADVIRLEGSTNWIKITKLGQISNHNIYLVKNDTWGTGAYILSKKTALFLLDQSPSLWLPSDTYIFAKSLSKIAKSLTVYQLNPTVACQDQFAEGVVVDHISTKFDSEIGDNKPYISSNINNKSKIKNTIAPYLGYLKTTFKN